MSWNVRMKESFEINPIIVKELRSRMRGMRAFLTLTLSLLLMGLILYALYQVAIASSQYSTSPISPQIGQILFTGLMFLLLFLIAAITPSITSGEISGERERQTYEMLMTTPLSPARILWGKLFASMSYVFLILFAAVPMASLIFIFGGINPRDMFKALIALVVITVMFGVIGLFYSTLLNRSGRATVMSYLTIGLLLFGPIFAAMLSGILRQQDPERWIMTPSPIMVLASTFQPSVNPESISSAFWMLGNPIYWILGAAPVSYDSIPRPAYHFGLPLYLFITLALYLLSTRLIRPVRRWKIYWYEGLLILILLLGLLGLTSIGYLASTNRYEHIIIASPTPTPILEMVPPIPDIESTENPDEQTLPDLVTPTPEPVGLLYDARQVSG